MPLLLSILGAFSAFADGAANLPKNEVVKSSVTATRSGADKMLLEKAKAEFKKARKLPPPPKGIRDRIQDQVGK